VSGIPRGMAKKDRWAQVLALPRADARAAADLFLEIQREDGEVPNDVARTLVMLQDDPAEYLRLIRPAT